MKLGDIATEWNTLSSGICCW